MYTVGTYSTHILYSFVWSVYLRSDPGCLYPSILPMQAAHAKKPIYLGMLCYAMPCDVAVILPTCSIHLHPAECDHIVLATYLIHGRRAALSSMDATKAT